MINFYRKNHNFHIVDPSLLPIVVSFSVFLVTYNGILYVHDVTVSGLQTLQYSLLFFITTLFWWFGTMNNESKQLFIYTKEVEKNILLGVVLFIISEIFLFVSVFWAFFHSSLNPSIFIGSVWPPIGIDSISPWKVPFLNTLILVISGITVNSFYYSLKTIAFSPEGISQVQVLTKSRVTPLNKIFSSFSIQNLNSIVRNLNGFLRFVNLITRIVIKQANEIKNSPKISKIVLNFFIYKTFWVDYLVKTIKLKSSEQKAVDVIENSWYILYEQLVLTILLGAFFLSVQLFEYVHASFSIADGIYGSVFYMSTGLHGTHVFVGLSMLIVCFFKVIWGDFTENAKIHVSCTSTVWYWHFVDVVWLFLFIFVYVWGA